METTKVNTISVMNIGKATSNYGKKNPSNDSVNSFQGFLQKSSSTDKKPMVKENRPSDKSVKDSSLQGNNQMNKNDKPEANDNNGKIKPKTKNEVKMEGGKLSDADQKKLDEFAAQIQKDLNLSPEEMQMWMSTLGVQLVDLVDSDKLQSFFMEVKGIDVSTLLTDANQAQDLKQLMLIANELKPMLSELKKDNKTESNVAFEEILVDNTTKTDSNQISSDKDMMDKNWSDDNQRTEEQFQAKEELPKAQAKDNQMPSAEGMAIFEKVIQTKEQIIVTANGLEKITTTISAKDILEQVVTKFTTESLSDTSKITVQLNPESLGKVAFQVVSKAGQMSGQFVAESEAVKAALEAQVSQLKVHLANQGIQVDDVKVVVGDTVNYFADDKPKEQQQELSKKKTSKRSDNRLEINAMDEEIGEESEPVMSSTGSVDFIA